MVSQEEKLDLDVNLIDTADSYGPAVSEELIAEVLYPYPSDLIIATKGGWERPGPDSALLMPAANTSRRHWKAVSNACVWITSIYINSMLRTTPSRSRPQSKLWPSCASRVRFATSDSPT
jgi:hypothetical protein